MKNRDADFSKSVIAIIASRAGYRCSFLGCDESTIGPGAQPRDVEKKGVAAHIFSSAAGMMGPRGTGGLSPEQRRQSDNGIWLCQDHARIIDNDRGKNYSASQLQSWKALHERTIAREVQKLPSNRGGWLETITIENNPIFVRSSRLVLGKVTLVIGGNGYGKTSLCQWLAGLGGKPEDLTRWGRDREHSEVNLRLQLYAPECLELSMQFKKLTIHLECNSELVLDFSHYFRVIALRELYRNHSEDDVEYLARIWGIHVYQVPYIINKIVSSKYGLIKDVKMLAEEGEDEDVEVSKDSKMRRGGYPSMALWCMFEYHNGLHQFKGLSGSEQTQILISGAMILADYYSSRQSVLLLLDLGSNLDDGNMSKYAELLQNREFEFQTLFLLPRLRSKVNWTGWVSADLVQGETKLSSIRQNG